MRQIPAQWLLLVFGFLMTFGSSFGQTFFISLFAEPLMDATGLTNAGYSALYSIATLGSAFALLWCGKQVDQYPAVRVAAWVFVGLVAGCLLLAWSPGPLILLAGFFLLRLCGQAMPGHISTSTLTREFTASRGRAISLANLGYPAGQAVFPLLAVFTVAWIGWRSSWVLFAAIVLLVLLPLVALMLRHARPANPGARHTSPTGQADNSDDGWTRARVLRDPVFYLITPALSAAGFIITGVLFHQVAIANEREWSLTVLASSHTAFALLQVGGSLLSGVVIDRFGARRVARWTLLPLVASSLFLALGNTLSALWLMMGLAGFSAGIAMPLGTTLLSEIYGTRHIGAIKSLILTVTVVGTAIAPVIYGLILDVGLGSYALGWLSVTYLVLALVGIWIGLNREARRHGVRVQ